MQEIFDYKLDLSALEDFQWDADEVTIGESTINDISGKKDFEKEGQSTAETFIRELIQNTLDAKLPGPSMVAQLNLEVVNFNSPLEKKIYHTFVNDKIYKRLIKCGNINDDYKFNYKALKASDFNTYGLDGILTSDYSNWNKYVFRTGNPKLSKGSNADGGRNLGKIATWKCSKLWMVFIRSQISKPYEETRFMGRCMTNGYSKIDGKNKLREPHEYFVKKKIRNKVNVDPALEKCLKNLFKSPRDKYGTDFLFPEFSAFDIKELIPYTIKNWFCPISEGDLEIKIEDTTINKNNIREVTKKVFSEEIFEGVNQEMMDFVINTRAGLSDININLELLDIPDRELTNFSEDYFDFKGYSLKQIATKLYEGSHLKLTVPVKIEHKNGPIHDEFYVAIKMRSERKGLATCGMMMRKNQILWDESKKSIFTREAKYLKDIMVAVISTNSELNKLLANFEESSHLVFNNESFTGESEYDIKNAKFILRLFRNASNRLINLIFAEDENENKDLLSQFFSLKFKEKKKKKKIIEEDDHIEDVVEESPVIDIDLPPSRSHVYSQDQVGNKLIINSINNEELCGKKIKIEFGIKKRGNTDAFVKVDEFDFNLLNQTDISFYSGCSIDNSSRKQTSIEIFVEDTSFSLELKGIKKAYSHKSRYTVI